MAMPSCHTEEVPASRCTPSCCRTVQFAQIAFSGIGGGSTRVLPRALQRCRRPSAVARNCASNVPRRSLICSICRLEEAGKSNQRVRAGFAHDNSVHPACFSPAVRRSPDSGRHACPERPVRHAHRVSRVANTPPIGKRVATRALMRHAPAATAARGRAHATAQSRASSRLRQTSPPHWWHRVEHTLW